MRPVVFSCCSLHDFVVLLALTHIVSVLVAPVSDLQPMAPPGGPGSEGVDQFGEEIKPPPGAGNFRVPLRGRAGRHRHTQSSAAVLHRSAYSTGSLGSAIQSEYSRHGKFLPLPPPDSIDEAEESPMGSPQSRGGSRSPREWQSKGSEILGGFKVGGALPPPKGSASSLRLELQRVAEPEPVDDEELAVRERLLNKFAQEVMRSYPPELVAAVCRPETELSASPSHRRSKPQFVLEDLDTSDWVGLVRVASFVSGFVGVFQYILMLVLILVRSRSCVLFDRMGTRWMLN